MSATRMVGVPAPRAEGPDKVTGRTRYAADVPCEGLLWGKVLRSPHAHARIRGIDASRARSAPGVKAVVTGPEAPRRFMGKQIRDMPVLCWDRVRYVGDRVAAVAAETPDAAEAALGLIEVDYEVLPAVFDPVEATGPGAPLLHDDVGAYPGAPHERLAADVRNGLTRLLWTKGDVEQGFRDADLTLEHTFRVPGRHQGYLEPHAGLVALDPDGRVRVWASTKDPFRTRRMLAGAIGVEEGRVRVHPVNVGGEFGGKGDARDLPIAFLLARESGRPVKIVMTYAEELTACNPDEATVMTVRTGVKRDGRIVARRVKAWHAGGAYGALKASASFATWHYAGGLYRVEHAALEFLQVYTNTTPGGYYRSPGSIPTFFALESHTDLIARELGMDPGEFRLRNVLRENEEDAIGKRLTGVQIHPVLTRALAAADWYGPGPGANRGRGVAIYGRHISGGETGITVSAEADGMLAVLSPTVDQGTGAHTILRQLAAERMQLALERVRVVTGDTDTAPYDTGARASRVTYTAGQAAEKACEELLARLTDCAARMLECGSSDVVYANGRFSLRTDPGQSLSLAQVASRNPDHRIVTVEEDFPYRDDVTYVCAQVAEVEVDPETGATRVERMVTAHDVGAVINPVTHQGQIDGGVVMGVGQALMEELVLEDGRVANASLGDYKLPTVRDVPRLETVLVESGGGLAPHGAKAIGEFANNNPPAAIANAVADAVGVRLFEIPVTAEKVFRGLEERGQGAAAASGADPRGGSGPEEPAPLHGDQAGRERASGRSGSQRRIHMLEGKVVVVTGGGKGIGRHAALTFAREKARVVIIDVNQEWLDKTGPELGEMTDALGINANVRNEDAVKGAFEQVVQRFGRIDVLVNNAAIVPHFAWGIPRWPLVRDMGMGFWDRVVQTNLGGTFLCTKHALDHMEPRRSGHIINLYGGGGVKPGGACAYVVTKDAIWTFTRYVAEEVRESNVCVVVFSPRVPIVTEGAPEEAFTRLPTPEILGQGFVLAAQAPMEQSGRLFTYEDGELVAGKDGRYE